MKKEARKTLSIFIAIVFAFSIAISGITSYADTGEVSKAEIIKENRPAYKEGELLIKFKDGVSSTKIASFASENGLKHKKTFDFINAGLYSTKGISTQKALMKLLESEDIEYVQPNYLYYPDSIPSDTYYNYLWGLNNTGQNVGTTGINDVDIDAPEAWDITQGSDSVVVAVIDTGIDVNHPELYDNMWRNPGEIPGNGLDDDGNGYTDDIYGWDFFEDDNSVFDSEIYDEHGTHVAGIIAAQANSEGVIGVAPNVKIMSLKFIGPNGGTTADAVEAINYARMMGVKISNNSWGGAPQGGSEDTLLRQTIEQSGMLFVASAGNDRKNIDYNYDFPSSFTSANILTVAAVDNKGRLADFSNYGKNSVDVGAPGVKILSTIPDIVEGIAAVNVSNTRANYKAFVATFGLENLGTQAQANDVLSKVMRDIYNINDSNTPILLVDDDGNDGEYIDVYETYSEALTPLGYTNIERVNVAGNLSNGPDISKLNEKDVVIWFTGDSFGGVDEYDNVVTTLTNDDQRNLMTYLNNGKTLILFGQDALFGIEESALVRDYFGIEIPLIDYGRNISIEGEESTVFEAVYYDVSATYLDHIMPRDIRDIIAKPMLRYKAQSGAFYGYKDGTSMAAPYVTGVAALLLSNNPNLTTAQLKAAIMNSGMPLSSLIDKTVSGRMVNAFNALNSIGAGGGSGDTGGSGGSGGSGSSGGSSGGSGGSGGGGGGGGGAAGPSAPSAPSAPNPSIDSIVNAALKNPQTGTIVKVPAVNINDTESASMNTKTIDSLSKSGKSLVLAGSSVEIAIPSSALLTEEVKKLISDSTARLSINIKEIKGKEAQKLLSNAAAGLFKTGDRIFGFTIELKTSKDTINISKFAQELKISIKLSAAETAGIDVKRLGVFYYNEAKKAWEYVGGVFNAKDSTITFATGHFSQFAVMRAESAYKDIDKHWAKSEIELMAAKHIIEADANGVFGPDVSITRAEIIKMLVNVLRYNPDKNIDLIAPNTATFKDVSINSPDFPYIETAVKYGITNGKGDGTFGPNDTVTREQLATMIIRAMGIEADSDVSALPFNDKDKLPDWAAKSVAAAYERGLVQGIGGNQYGVGSTATRAQAAVIIKRVMEKSGLIMVPKKLTGKLVISDIEGQHYELETKDGIYVLVHDLDSRHIAKLLNSLVGKDVEVSGYEQSGYNIYQRGKVFKVISIE